MLINAWISLAESKIILTNLSFIFSFVYIYLIYLSKTILTLKVMINAWMVLTATERYSHKYQRRTLEWGKRCTLAINMKRKENSNFFISFHFSMMAFSEMSENLTDVAFSFGFCWLSLLLNILVQIKKKKRGERDSSHGAEVPGYKAWSLQRSWGNLIFSPFIPQLVNYVGHS